MLSKKARLTSREFAAVLERGFEARIPAISLRYTKGDAFKCSVAASRKLWKTAAARSRVRRRLYGSVERISRTRRFKPFSVALFPLRQVEDLDTSALDRLLESVFVKGRIIE